MIRVTDEATTLLATIDRPEGTVLRVEPAGQDQLQLVVGEAQPGDQVVEREGQDLLHISGAISNLLDGLAMDRVDTEEGPTLAFVREGRSEP